MLKLNILFNSVQEKAFNLRKKNKNADGYAFWQPLKKILQKYDNICVSMWKNKNKKYVNKIMSLPEYIKNGYGNEEIIEVNHFIIQQVRIPLNEKPNLRKIIQIALNIGQFRGSSNRNFRKKISYEKNKLYMLETYVKKKDIRYISECIPDDLINKILNYLEKY